MLNFSVYGSMLGCSITTDCLGFLAMSAFLLTMNEIKSGILRIEMNAMAYSLDFRFNRNKTPRIFAAITQKLPPKVPVYSYHCTHEG